MFWSPQNLQTITAGRFLIKPADGSPPAAMTGVSTDSRALRPGQVFVALRGEKFDGHDYLNIAIESGTPMLIVDRAESANELRRGAYHVLLVDNTTTALAQLAAAYRNTLPGRIIAVTGSVGKTTTKQMIDTVLGVRFTGRASPKSFNNHIGVPLTLLNAEPTDAYIVCEVGTNAPGEIGALAKIIRPDIAIITAVGVAHLEGLGDRAGVLREKASLLSHLREGGLAIVNGDVPGLTDYRKVAPSMVTYGRGTDCDMRLTDYLAEADSSFFVLNNRWKYHLPLLGEHNAFNALAAIAVARHMKMTEDQIAAGFERVTPPAGRLATQTIGPITIIDDSYNANPDSMAAALSVLSKLPTRGRRIAVLGDMLELGEASPQFHRELGEDVVASDIDLVITIGRMTMFTAEIVTKQWPGDRVYAVPTWTDAAGEAIVDRLAPGDTVLLKASRGMAVERLVPIIRKRFETNHTAGV